MAGTLTLKWGTLKGWSNLDQTSLTALQTLADMGFSLGAMQQKIAPEHIQALCNLIDTVDEPIYNDWSGEEMSKAEAKTYIQNYNTPQKDT